MRMTTVAILVVALLVSVACGQEEGSSVEGGQTPPPPDVSIHLAALQGNTDVIRGHVVSGTDLNEKDAYGSTPLVIAATFGRADVARVLLEAGADPEITNNDGSAPMHIAAFLGHADIIAALLEAGADVHSRNMTGSTAFDITASPLDGDKVIYDQLSAALAPFGFASDYERVEAARPAIAGMLTPRAEELEGVAYEPQVMDDWSVSTPEEQGLDPTLVSELFLDASRMENLYGLLVIKNGQLVAEGYFNEGAIDRSNLLQSATKSFVSALVGIALDDGRIESVDQKMMEFFPEFADSVDDLRKERITIRHLLQMRAGYPWEESTAELWEVLLSGDYLRRTTDLELINDPGAAFNYSNLSSHFLGVIVARSCDTDLESLAQERLLSPIGARVGDWGQDRDGYRIGGGGIYMTARDAARFGLLYLNDGEHEGESIVPAEWVRESLTSYSDDAWVTHARLSDKGRYFSDLGYGYQWWSATVGEHHVDYAAGHGGQYIVLLEDLDMVIVVASDPYYLVHDAEAWKHELASLNLIGKFISSLPAE